jgi:hypothetical protein
VVRSAETLRMSIRTPEPGVIELEVGICAFQYAFGLES